MNDDELLAEAKRILPNHFVVSVWHTFKTLEEKQQFVKLWKKHLDVKNEPTD